MASTFSVLFISSMIFFIYGLPVQIARPKRTVERIKYTRVNPEELGGGVEGDMIIPRFNSKRQLRGAAVHTNYKWPQGIIPYDISAITDRNDQAIIEQAMDTLESHVGFNSISGKYCVDFRPRKLTDKIFLTIEYGKGCSASLGYNPTYNRTMTLDNNPAESCFHSSTSTIQHELMHVLGFTHEQNRADRDGWVTINYDNVNKTYVRVREFEFYKTDNVNTDVFKKLSKEESTDLNTQYDYDSILHYDRTAFSKDGNSSTIVPKCPYAKIGGQEKLSLTDIQEVRKYYNCGDRSTAEIVRIWPWPKCEKYEGQSKDGKMHGQGTFTWWSNGNKYTGDWVDNKMHGRGNFTWENGDRYEGQFNDGKRTGKGKYYSTNRLEYDGDWIDGKKIGKGTFYFTDGNKYEGDWVNDQRTGQGNFTWPYGARYEGQFKDGKITGKGIYYFADGGKYDGDWIDGKKTGKGTLYFASGDKYEGDWVDDQRTGQGVFTSSKGARYEGQFKNGNFNGKGTYYFTDGSKYEGDWVDYQRTGQGTLTLPSGDRYEGQFKNGNFDGKGAYYFANGYVKEGMWSNGRYIN